MALELFFVSARTIKRHHHHWRVANAYENDLLQSFCGVNDIEKKISSNGYLPTTYYRGTVNDLDKQPYIQVPEGDYKAYEDKDGSPWDWNGENRASAQLFIQKIKRGA